MEAPCFSETLLCIHQIKRCNPRKWLRTTVCDCGACSWPWQWFALGKPDRPVLSPSSRYIHVKNKLYWSSIVFFAYEITQLFPVVFCVIRAVQTFYFTFLINKTCNNWRLAFLLKTYVVQLSRVFSGSTHAVQVSCILLSKRLQQRAQFSWHANSVLRTATVYATCMICAAITAGQTVSKALCRWHTEATELAYLSVSLYG